jgi:hypothetical protein
MFWIENREGMTYLSDVGSVRLIVAKDKVTTLRCHEDRPTMCQVSD